MVWRHLAAIASWEGLLLRVDTLLGPQARETVARLRLRDENEDTSAFEVTSEVVAKTLANPGFAEFVKNRFADNSVVNALFERARGTITSPSTSTYSATCDFIADFLFQETEFADIAHLPRTLATADDGTPWTTALARYAGGNSISQPPAAALESLLGLIIERRSTIRNAVLEALQADPVLHGLVSCRLLPYAESRFFIAGTQRLSDYPADMLLLWTLHRHNESRLRRVERLDWAMIRADSEATRLIRNVAESLSRASVPFLYWCAKLRLDIRRMWVEADGAQVGLWPLPRSPGHGRQCVAIATRVDGQSFSLAMRFLMESRKGNPQATCLLVTDQWNDEHAAAVYEAAIAQGPARPIVVLRSDGPQYPPCAFTFPMT